MRSITCNELYIRKYLIESVSVTNHWKCTKYFLAVPADWPSSINANQYHYYTLPCCHITPSNSRPFGTQTRHKASPMFEWQLMKLSEVVEQLEGFQLFEIVTQITYFLTMYLFQIYFSLFYVFECWYFLQST